MKALPSNKLGWTGWIVLLLAVIEAGWLAFDGSRAFILGDYMTPASGEYAGQLGPWADLVSSIGIEPRSTLMKSIHIGLGLAWLFTCAAFARRLPWAWRGMLICAIASLWYLTIGTLLSAIQIVLLLLPPLRKR